MNDDHINYSTQQAESPHASDGPCQPYTWRKAGNSIGYQMQPAAWNLVNYLWDQWDRSATFADLKLPVYDDPEHPADHNAFGSLRRAANNFFRKHGIPWQVCLKKRVVYLDRFDTTISAARHKCPRSARVLPDEVATLDR